jgi:hypothetical protein
MFETVAHQMFGHGHYRREYAQQVTHYGQYVEFSVGVGDFSKLTLVRKIVLTVLYVPCPMDCMKVFPRRTLSHVFSSHIQICSGEAVVYANGSLYGYLLQYPFSSYGENVSLLCQNVVLIAMAWGFSAKTSTPTMFQERLLVIGAFIWYVVAIVKYLPDEYRYILMSFTWPVMLYARGTQVLETYRVQQTGNLSIVTTSMNLFGSLIRIMTTLQETGDLVVLGGYLLSGGLSLIMFVQYWWYWENTMNMSEQMKQDAKTKQA